MGRLSACAIPTLAIVTVFAITSSFIASSTLASSDTWWNSSWPFRKQINITERSGRNITDYQLPIAITATSKMASNLSDLRFADSNGNELPYFKAPTIDSFYVKIPNVTASGAARIYMYYGNSSMASKSDVSILQFFEDFEGSDINRTRWVTGNLTGGTCTIETGCPIIYVVSNSQLDLQGGSLTLNSSLPVNMSQGYAVDARGAYAFNGYAGRGYFIFGDCHNLAYACYNPTFGESLSFSYVDYLIHLSSFVTGFYGAQLHGAYSNDTFSFGEPMDFTYGAVGTSTYLYYYDVSGRSSSPLQVRNDYPYLYSTLELMVPMGYPNLYPGHMIVYNIAIRKFTYPEPNYTIGAEEMSPYCHWTTAGVGAGTGKCCSAGGMCVDGSGSCQAGYENATGVTCSDGLDNDCDGTVDCLDSNCSAALACLPAFDSFSYSATMSTLNALWTTHNPSGPMVGVECRLNGAQTCLPYPNIGPVGTGSCAISSPSYAFTPAKGAPQMAVENNITCGVYDTSDTHKVSNSTYSFRPAAVDADVPQKLNPTVGEPVQFQLTVRNNGTLDDSYDVTVTTPTPNTINITNGNHTTQTLGASDSQQLFAQVTLLGKSDPMVINTTVRSRAHPDIFLSQLTYVSGEDKSLPEFGAAGLLQIIVAAAAVLTLSNDKRQ